MADKDLCWVKLDGEYRPALLSKNTTRIKEELDKKDFYENQQLIEQTVERIKERTGKETWDEFTEDEQTEVLLSTGSQQTLFRTYWAMLKDGANYANHDFTTEQYTIRYDPEKDEEIREKSGDREISIDDVTRWIEDNEEAEEKLLEYLRERKPTAEQEDQLEIHKVRKENSDPKKKEDPPKDKGGENGS